MDNFLVKWIFYIILGIYLLSFKLLQIFWFLWTTIFQGELLISLLAKSLTINRVYGTWFHLWVTFTLLLESPPVWLAWWLIMIIIIFSVITDVSVICISRCRLCQIKIWRTMILCRLQSLSKLSSRIAEDKSITGLSHISELQLNACITLKNHIWNVFSCKW